MIGQAATTTPLKTVSRYKADFPGLCCKDDRRRWEDGDNWIRSPLCGGIEKTVMKIACPRISRPPIFRICPFRIIAIASKTCQCSSGGSEPAEAEPRSDQTLDCADDPAPQYYSDTCIAGDETAPEFAVSLHLRDRPWDRRGSCRP